MIPSKFASITSSLLARKGEAKPWEEPPKKAMSWKDDLAPQGPGAGSLPMSRAPEDMAPPPFADVMPAAVRPEPRQTRDAEFSDLSEIAAPAEPDKVKKCAIRMSLHDYERLGIIAVKRNVTRQHLLHDALDQFFAAAAEQYRKECACLNADACCQG